jgi:hypothetical protein
MAEYDWCITNIPNYKEVCYSECPEDFKIDEVEESFKFAFEKIDGKWHQLKEETQILVLCAAEVGIQTVTMNNISGWLTRLAMLQGLYGPFMHNDVPVAALYQAQDVITELKEKYDDLPESVDTLEQVIAKSSKHVPIPKQMDPLVLIAHVGFTTKVEKKTWQKFCSSIASKADELIAQSIEKLEAIRAEKLKEQENEEVEGEQ